MFTLVYASTAARPFSPAELLELLHRSREKNARVGITGLLLYKAGAFMQALEGEEAAVAKLYARICEDPRHHHVSTLVATTAPERQFAEWPMGFKNLDGSSEVDPGPAFNPHPHPPPAPSSGREEPVSHESIAVGLMATFQYDS